MGLYLALLLLPVVLSLPLLPGWLREQRAIHTSRPWAYVEPVAPARPAKLRKRDLLGRFTAEEIDSVRRVLIAQRAHAKATATARRVEVLELADVRKVARKAKRSQARAAA